MTEIQPGDMIVETFVPGEPAPKGSTRAFAVKASNRRGMRAVTVPDNGPAQRGWTSAVVAAVLDGYGSDRPLYCGPVHVHVDFVMPRRKSAPKTSTPAHTRKPDGDKLTRCTWDALTGTVIADDAQIVAWSGSKREAEPGERPGAYVRVEAMPASAPARPAPVAA